MTEKSRIDGIKNWLLLIDNMELSNKELREMFTLKLTGQEE